MTKDKTVTMSRETLEKCLRDALLIRFEQDSHVEELRAILAAPVVERQPIGYLFRLRGPEDRGWNFFSGSATPDSMSVYEVKPVFDSPPEPVAVVLPGRKPRAAADWEDLDRRDLIEDVQFAGWNACLDKVKELNQ